MPTPHPITLIIDPLDAYSGLIRELVAKANSVLNSPEFYADVLAHREWKHPPGHVRANDTSADVLERLLAPRTMRIGSYSPWWPWSAANARTIGHGAEERVELNRRRLAGLDRDGLCSAVVTLVHEVAHVAGYGHVGNHRDAFNLQTVPYAIEPYVRRAYQLRFGNG